MIISELLNDINNLKIIATLVNGESVTPNIKKISQTLNKHRNTIQKRIDHLFEYHIIEAPFFPFSGIFKVYPLLSILNIDIPECDQCARAIKQWMKEDAHIFMAYNTKQSNYDTLLFTLHENLGENHLWISNLPKVLEEEYNVSEEHATFHSSVVYFSNHLMRKFDPGTGLNLLEERFNERQELSINGYSLQELDLKIMRLLMTGEGIKYNRSHLCNITGLHRRTVDNRVESLLSEGLLSPPVSMFPNWFVPPSYLLSYYLVNLNDRSESVIKSIIDDKHISLATQTVYEKYNMLLFGSHHTLEEQWKWLTDNRDIIDDVKSTYLSQEMTIVFNMKAIALRYLELKMRKIMKPK